jgi:TetR/AcrR family tetracycline transcriptional repressor
VVNRERVVGEALKLLDEVGFDGLTMRRLADALGLQAASLYNHVRDKDELLTLIADEICKEIPELDPRKPWRRQLEWAARECRRVLLGHRDAARVLAATLPIGPNRLRTIEQVLEIFCAAGFSGRDATNAAFVFNTYVVGFILGETQALPGGGPPPQELLEQGKRAFKALPKDRYPRLVALADYLFESSQDRRFEFGLHALLDGLELRPRRRAKKG